MATLFNTYLLQTLDIYADDTAILVAVPDQNFSSQRIIVIN